jgi:hypothetical protein
MFVSALKKVFFNAMFMFSGSVSRSRPSIYSVNFEQDHFENIKNCFLLAFLPFLFLVITRKNAYLQFEIVKRMLTNLVLTTESGSNFG